MGRIIGLDIGTWSVKATLMEGGFSRFEVTDCRVQQVPQRGDELPTLSERLTAVQTLLADLSLDDGTLIGAAYPIDKASMRWVAMPFSDKAQIAQTLPFEVEGLVPFDLDDMIVEHRVIGPTNDGSAVLAGIVPREGLAEHLRALTEAGIDPKTVVIDGDLLSAHGRQGITAVIDLGHARTIVTVVSEGQTLFSRAISIGGWHLTRALSSATGMEWASAEKQKHQVRLATRALAELEEDDGLQPAETGLGAEEGDRNAEVIEQAIAPLLAIIRTTLIGFEDQTGREVDQIVLTGGTSALHGLDHLVSAEMGVPVSHATTASAPSASGSPHTLSVPLARRAAAIGSTSCIELRHGEFRFRGNMANVRNIALASVAAVFLCIMGTVGWFAYQYSEATSQLQQLDMQLAEAVSLASGDEGVELSFASPDDALTALQLQTIEASARIDLLGSIVADSPPVVTTLNHLSTSLPDPQVARIDVSELTVTKQSINFKAVTDGYDAAANIESSIAANTRFKGARKGDEKKTVLGIFFSVTIPIGSESTEEEG